MTPRRKTMRHASVFLRHRDGSSAPIAWERESRGISSDVNARAKVYLHPGQLFAAAQPSAITTILGSCVSVCLWDPVVRIGGMNHYLLPFSVGDELASPRFGTVAIEALIERVLVLGARHDRLLAKLFGGACVIEAFREKEDHIGVLNARLAESMLHRACIPIVEQHLAGCRGRKILFNTDDGASSVKYL